MSKITVEPARLLLVEDDEADILLAQRAFERANVWNPVDVVRDGREALDYLQTAARIWTAQNILDRTLSC